jgi:hypothetical protein
MDRIRSNCRKYSIFLAIVIQLECNEKYAKKQKLITIIICFILSKILCHIVTWHNYKLKHFLLFLTKNVNIKAPNLASKIKKNKIFTKS